MSELSLQVIDDTVEHCVAKYGADKEFPSDIENIVLSRLYAYAIRDSQNYSWHVFVSEVHEPPQA